MTETTIARSLKKSRSATFNDGKSKLKAGVSEDSAEVRSLQLLEAVRALRDGDFSVRLPVGWAGTDGQLAEAFNQALAHQDRIAREITRLSVAVGKEGRLKQRMSVPGAIGGWALNVDSLNTLLDDLVRPTTDVARTIGAVAKGDLGQSMELEADGRELKRESRRTAKLGNSMTDQLSSSTSYFTPVVRESTT